MDRDNTPGVSLESLKKEAKSWLKAIRANDAPARARLKKIHPQAPSTPTLRDVQHALALEHGCKNWRSLKEKAGTASQTAQPLSRDEAIRALLYAAACGNATRVAELLDAHTDIINERSLLEGHSGMRTALHYAVGGKHTPVVRLLLERGANPNIRCEGDWAFPLHFAAEKAHMDIVRLLIEHGADPIGEDDYHESEVIGWACFGHGQPNRELVEYLLAHGARHTIFSAVATGDIEAIHRLARESSANLERRMDGSNRRRRPLHQAVVKDQPEALAALLNLGAEMNTLDQAGLTALDEAALRGKTTMAQRLIDQGAEIGMAAAVALQRTADIERLMRKDPAGLKPGHRWGTLIVRASEHSTGSVIEALLRLGAEVNAWDEPGTAVDGATRFTPLHAAATSGNVEAAAILLKHGANPAIREGRYCGTPVGWANYFNHPDVRDMVLNGPIDIFDAIDFSPERIAEVLSRDAQAIARPFGAYAVGQPRSGQWWPEPWCTPLMWSVVRGNMPAMRELLERGAAVDVLTPDGRTLVELASQDRRAEVVTLLQGYRNRAGR
jgi:ankyrin repeat protein